MKHSLNSDGVNMNQDKIRVHSDEFVDELKTCADRLVINLQKNEFQEASTLICELLASRDQHLFNSVGQLTRGLHDAIVNFHVDNNDVNSGDSEMRDASDRLQYVINLTQDAANTTMDKVEAVSPIAQQLGEDAQLLKNDWVRLKNRELDKNDFNKLYEKIDVFLDQMDDGTIKLNKAMQDIVLEQGYQDLTGQVLKRVIGLITDVENNLVNLMRIAGQVEQVTGVVTEKSENKIDGITPEGPQIHAEKRDDVVSSQDDVDDLLSSLGF